MDDSITYENLPYMDDARTYVNNRGQQQESGYPRRRNVNEGARHNQEIIYTQQSNEQDHHTRDDRELLDLIEDTISRIKNEVGRDGPGKKPKNVAIIGLAGAGKSAFINTVIAAMSQDRWKEKAYSGHHGLGSKAVTTNISV